MRLGFRTTDAQSDIPLTVIGGPPGAGKSSVIRHVLHTRDARRLVAVVRHLVPSTRDTRQRAPYEDPRLEWIEGTLSFASQDPSDILMQLAALERRPDHVIVEADGAEHPQRLNGFAYMPGYRPDGFVTVIDAADAARESTFRQSLEQPTIEQLRHADLVVLNKLDLVGLKLAASCQRMLTRFAPAARFVWSENGRVAAPLILGASADNVSSADTNVTAAWRPDYLPVASRDNTSLMGERCRSWSLVADTSIRAREFRSWVGRLPEIVVRGSGTVWLQEAPQHRYEFYLMGGRWRLDRGAPWGEALPRTRLSVLTLGGEMRRVRHGFEGLDGEHSLGTPMLPNDNFTPPPS